jgi:hypothetical protein
MKDFLSVNCVFSPAASGVGTVFLDIPNFDPKRLVAIINQTRGVMIYSTGSIDLRYSSISGNTLTLFFDTTGHSASDVLQVIYNSDSPLEVIADKTNETISLLNILVDLLFSNAIVDAGQRQKIVIDAITAGLTLATVTTVGTVGTVSAVSSVTNVTSLFGVDRQMYHDMLNSLYDSGIRNRIDL